MIIAVWGRDGVGKSLLCDALGLLLSQKDVAAIIDTDLTQPTLPIRLNGFHLDDYMSYEAGLDADETAQDFVEQCSELADTVILNLSGQRTDPFLPGALLHADKVVVMLTPDVQGICWYQSVAPLLRNRQTQGHVLPVATMIGKHHDIPAIEPLGLHLLRLCLL
jgi:MinD-like ATPase involved in chromosome partitioning or flagellar assembly